MTLEFCKAWSVGVGEGDLADIVNEAGAGLVSTPGKPEAFAEAAWPREKVNDRNCFEPRNQFFSFVNRQGLACMAGEDF